MEQYNNNVSGQIAANNIYNICIELRNSNLDINDLTSEELLDAVLHFKSKNRKIIRLKYLNVPSISIVFLSLFLIMISLLNVKSIITNGISTPLFSSNTLFVIVLISVISYSILSRLLYSRTKFLNPIFVENKKVIYELELEIQRRKLRGEDEK